MLEPSQLPIPSTKFLCSLNNICSFRVVPARWFILVVGRALSTIISPAQSQSFRRKEFGKNREVCTLTAYLQLSTWENCPSKLLVSFSAAASTLWLSWNYDKHNYVRKIVFAWTKNDNRIATVPIWAMREIKILPCYQSCLHFH